MRTNRCVFRSAIAAWWLVLACGRLALGVPFDDAAAVWHMGDAVANDFGTVTVEGNVKLGVPLVGSELEASRSRCGDGRVAQFDGGYLRIAADARRPLTLTGKEMTLCMRVRDASGEWLRTLFGKDARHDKYANILYGREGALNYLWQTEPIARRVRGAVKPHSEDFADGVLRLRAPATLIDPARWHDVIVRFRNASLEMFVDGVVVDEEWPHGELFGFAAPFLIGAGYDSGQIKSGFRGQIDHVALWNRALKDDEITLLSGGAEAVARRERQWLGPQQMSMQYWKPRGDVFAGDCMPFFHDGTLHLFYLRDRHHHFSKWGQGASQFAHASSKDLIRWEHHPVAVPLTEQWECAMGTGDIVWHDGLFHVFYTDCSSRCEYKDKPQPGASIYVATSRDGVHFKKDAKALLSGHDCTIIHDKTTGLFHLIRGGANRLVSKDLRNWEEVPGEFVKRRAETSDECPAYFAWNGWHYFILGRNAIWKSRHALGPWEEIAPTIYDGLLVPKVSEFTGNRRILAGFLISGNYAGQIVFRELLQHPDGSLGMKFVPEMVPNAGKPVRPTFTSLRPQATGDGVSVSLESPPSESDQRFALAALDELPKNYRLTLRVVPQAGTSAFGLGFRGHGDFEGGCELRFDPARGSAQFARLVDGQLAGDVAGKVWIGRNYCVEHFSGLDKPLRLDVIVKDDIIDVCVNQDRTMITRRVPVPEGNRLFLFAKGGAVRFDEIVIRPLVDEAQRSAGPPPAE